jgi:hypothetical protein
VEPEIPSQAKAQVAPDLLSFGQTNKANSAFNFMAPQPKPTANDIFDLFGGSTPS